MTTTKAALSFADQIAAIEKLQQSLPESMSDEYEEDYLPELDKELSKIILMMKNWPVESITSMLRESFNMLIQQAGRAVEEEKISRVSITIDYLLEYVLPVLSAGDGLEARLQIAEELTIRMCADCGVGYFSMSSDSVFDCVKPYLIFGIEIKDSRKWSTQLIDKIEQTCDDFEKRREIQKKYFDAVRYEESYRKKLGIDPDAELTKELLLDHLNAMKEAKPDAHANTVRSWKNAAESLYMLVVYTDAVDEQKWEGVVDKHRHGDA